MTSFQELLDAAAAAVGQGEPNIGRDLARTAAQLARVTGAPSAMVAEALLVESNALGYAHDYLGAYRRALEAGAMVGNDHPDIRVRFLDICSQVCRVAGEIGQAEEFSRAALEICGNAEVRPGTYRRALAHHAANLRHLQDFDAALTCFVQALELPEPDDAKAQLRNAYVLTLLDQADLLERQGNFGRAGTIRKTAVEALPRLDLNAFDFVSSASPYTVAAWIRATARVGHGDVARQCALRLLLAFRHRASRSHYRVVLLATLAEVHVSSGRWSKGIHRFEEAIAASVQDGNCIDAIEFMYRLVAVHSSREDHRKALEQMRRAEEARHRLHTGNAALELRMAESAGTVRLKWAAHKERRIHAQRLALLGRLVGSIQYALCNPVHEMLRTLQGWCAGNRADRVEATLRDVLRHVDRATALTRQLQLFTHMAETCVSMVSLYEAVAEALRDVQALGVDLAPLQLTGDRELTVPLDARRLGILLRILFIEALVCSPSRLSAHIGQLNHAPHLELDIHSHSLTPFSEVALTLCARIAAEMGSHLQVLDSSPALTRIGICLGDAPPISSRASKALAESV